MTAATAAAHCDTASRRALRCASDARPIPPGSRRAVAPGWRRPRVPERRHVGRPRRAAAPRSSPHPRRALRRWVDEAASPWTFVPPELRRFSCQSVEGGRVLGHHGLQPGAVKPQRLDLVGAGPVDHPVRPESAASARARGRAVHFDRDQAQLVAVRHLVDTDAAARRRPAQLLRLLVSLHTEQAAHLADRIARRGELRRRELAHPRDERAGFFLPGNGLP